MNSRAGTTGLGVRAKLARGIRYGVVYCTVSAPMRVGMPIAGQLCRLCRRVYPAPRIRTAAAWQPPRRVVRRGLAWTVVRGWSMGRTAEVGPLARDDWFFLVFGFCRPPVARRAAGLRLRRAPRAYTPHGAVIQGRYRSPHGGRARGAGAACATYSYTVTDGPTELLRPSRSGSPPCR